MSESLKTPRTQIRRLPKRGSYDRAAVNLVLDAGQVATLGFVQDGKPLLIPMVYARIGEELLIHGSKLSRLMQTLSAGTEVAVAVTLLDGLVLARSAFHHSMNYRSAVVFGPSRAVTDPDERMKAFKALTEKVSPGRWDKIRGPNRKELAATAVAAITIREGAVKSRTGGPVDDAADLALPVWAGVIPITEKRGRPVPDPEWKRRFG